MLWDLRKNGDAFMLKFYEKVKGERVEYIQSFGSLEAVKCFIDDQLTIVGECWSIEEPTNEVC